jgi:transcriptional regulator with XRE-family HTH domain
MTETFATILDRLCTRPDGREPFTNTELARIITRSGGEITDGYISHLRKGHRDNPTLQTVEDLAAALGVCPAVFVGGRRERLGDERPRRSFRRKLRHLFAAIHPPHRGPYTPEEVAASITSAGRYGSISSSYIRELLNSGHEPNPRLRHILALADFFGLGDDHGPQAAYFLDDRLAETIDAELAEFIALRDAGVVEFAARLARHASDWTPELRRQAVHALTEAVETGGTTWVFRSGGARR